MRNNFSKFKFIKTNFNNNNLNFIHIQSIKFEN